MQCRGVSAWPILHPAGVATVHRRSGRAARLAAAPQAAHPREALGARSAALVALGHGGDDVGHLAAGGVSGGAPSLARYEQSGHRALGLAELTEVKAIQR